MVKFKNLQNMFKIIEVNKEHLNLYNNDIERLEVSVPKEQSQKFITLLTSYRSLNFLFDIMDCQCEDKLAKRDLLLATMKSLYENRDISQYFAHSFDGLLNSINKEDYKTLTILMHHHIYFQVLIELYRIELLNVKHSVPKKIGVSELTKRY